MTTVAYLGNFRYPWCTEVHIQRSLEALGHEVVRLQEDFTDPADVEQIALDQGAGLVLYTRTWGKPAQLTDIWRRLEAHGVKTASYHLDLYLGIEREATLIGDPFWSTQYIFTPDGDPASAEQFAARGINHHWMPPAVVADECVMGTHQDRYAHDVVFVGSESYHREWPWRTELLGWLRETYGGRFKRYGGGAEVVRGERLNDLYASAKVVVGDSLCPGYSKPNYWSDRPYETVGRGGFLIMPRVPGLEAHFTGGEHLRFYEYGNFEQLRSFIDGALLDDRGRDQIRRRGQEHVRANHTYTHRLSEALRIMEVQ